MRRIDPELQARLDSGATTLCRCWRVERLDGRRYGFTDHDADLIFDGTQFRADSGLDATAVEASTGLSVDNGQVMGALSDAGVSGEEVRAGRFDRARIEQRAQAEERRWQDVKDRLQAALRRASRS